MESRNRSLIKCIVCVSTFTLLYLTLTVGADYINNPNRFVFKFIQQDGRSKFRLFKHLEQLNFTMLYEITPSTYIFEYNGSRSNSELLQEISRIKSLYPHQIIAAERVKVYRDTPKQKTRVTNTIGKKLTTRRQYSIIVAERVKVYRDTSKPKTRVTKTILKKLTTRRQYSGRRGLGTIYVVPAGPPGNELSNNSHTVSVNSIGRHGSIMRGADVDASVLTYGLGQGNNLTALNMVIQPIRC